MKLRNCLLLIIALLVCTTGNTYAGFLVKKQKQQTATTTTANNGNVLATAPADRALRKEERLNKLNTVKDFLLAKQEGKKDEGKKDGHNNNTGWEGIVSIICAGLPLVFTPFGGWALALLLAPAAIVFGALGLAHNKPNRGLAIAGLILGIAELFIAIIALIIILLFVGAIF